MNTLACMQLLKAQILARSHLELVNATYNEEFFGNFIVDFRVSGKVRSFVCDRTQIFIYDKRDGKYCDGDILIEDLNSIETADIEAVIEPYISVI